MLEEGRALPAVWGPRQHGAAAWRDWISDSGRHAGRPHEPSSYNGDARGSWSRLCGDATMPGITLLASRFPKSGTDNNGKAPFPFQAEKSQTEQRFYRISFRPVSPMGLPRNPTLAPQDFHSLPLPLRSRLQLRRLTRRSPPRRRIRQCRQGIRPSRPNHLRQPGPQQVPHRNDRLRRRLLRL